MTRTVTATAPTVYGGGHGGGMHHGHRLLVTMPTVYSGGHGGGTHHGHRLLAAPTLYSTYDRMDGGGMHHGHRRDQHQQVQDGGGALRSLDVVEFNMRKSIQPILHDTGHGYIGDNNTHNTRVREGGVR